MTSPTTTVVVDALSMHFGGGTTFLTSELAALQRVAPDLELRVLAAPWNAEPLQAAVGTAVEVVEVGDGWRRVGWEQVQLPRRGSGASPALLYCPGNSSPLLGDRVPCVLGVQNPNLFGRGRALPHNRRWNRRLRIALASASVRRADRIITISHALARAIVEDLPGVRGRCSVVHPGAPELPVDGRRPAGLPAEAERFFVSIANDAPHKDLDLVVAAWDLAHDKLGDRAPALVLAGRVDESRQAFHRELLRAAPAEQLVHLGAVSSARELSWLLQHATASVSASWIEGFGFTPVEAGQLGCPVIASDIEAHREVGGSHLLYFEVGDERQLADQLIEVAANPVRRIWSWPVTWRDHAERLAAIFREVATA
jgi:glycosyltransferase involved in cell wall biosynthesis